MLLSFGPVQLNEGVPINPLGRVREHVSIRSSPVMMGEEDVVRKTVAGTIMEL